MFQASDKNKDPGAEDKFKLARLMRYRVKLYDASVAFVKFILDDQFCKVWKGMLPMP